MQPSPDPGPQPSPREGRRPLRPGGLARQLWSPAPVPRPAIAPGLDELPWPERSGEAIRFALLSAEHWLSQGGVLREWLRLNLWLSVVLTLFAVLLVPPVTALLEGAAEWTSLGSAIVGNVTAAVLKLPPVVLAAATLLLAARLLQRHWIRRRKAGRYREDAYEGYEGYR